MPSASLAATLGALLTVTFKNPPAAEDAAKSLIEDPLTMERVGFIGIGDDKFKPTCLTDESASLFRTFLRTVRDLPNADKVKYIQDGTIDGAGRQAYKSWFKSICGDFNRRVELAMSETGYHPLQLLQTRIDDDYFDISSTASAALTDVALALFGPIVLDGSDVLVDSNLIGYMKTLLVFNYQRMARHRVRSQKDIDAAVEAMEEAMNAVNASNPPKMNDVRVAIRACKAVISIAIWFPERLTQAEEHMAFLDGFVRRNAKVPEGLDPHVVSEKPGAEERIARARERGYNIKASDSDLSDPYQIKQTLLALVTYLEEVNAADANPHAEDLEDISPDELFSEDGDMGVDLWKSKSPEELQSLLLFPGGKPQDWNAYSSVSGSTCWEKDVDRAPFQEGGPGFNPIALHWHQLAGVCSSTFKMFTAEPTTNVPGTILADGVGVGKTAQIMGTIAFLQQVFVSEQAADRSRPPLIANRPYFMGKGPVPDAPHLIVVPLSLMAQWHKELRTFFKDGAVDIFRLPLATGDVRKFFNHPKGAWKRSEQKMHKRIVICAQSTFTTLTSKSYNCARGAASIPVDRSRIRKPDSINTGTIFDIEWCTTTIDEAHLFRGPTRGFVGACQLRLSGKTWVLNLATATPLYTQFRDVFNLARMIGISDFSLTEGLLWEKTLARRIQATKRSLTQAQRNALRTGDLRQLTGESVDNSAANEIRLTNYSVVKEIQRGLGHNIIRRTLDSKQYDGTALNGKMPPVTSHTIFVKLTERELKNLQLLVDEIGGGLVPSDLHLEHFWLKYRIGVIFFNIFGDDWPELIDGLINGIPYDACFSSKLQECITLVKHLLSHDGVDHAYWTEEDGLVCPPITPGTEVRQTRKVLVFYEFTMMTPTIVSIFRHFGVDPYVLNSTLNDREREAVVSSFVTGTDPARRVLLFSAVGAVGLNLTCADVIIMLDTQWSQVGVEQIIGRCARLTQEKPVHIYYLLALQTTDVLMTTLAREKGEMLDTLLTRGGNEELEKLLKGINSKDLGNDDALEIDPATGSSSTTKVSRRTRKSAASKGTATETATTSSSLARQAVTATSSSISTNPTGASTEVEGRDKKGKKKANAAKSNAVVASKKKNVKGKGKAVSPQYVPPSFDETSPPPSSTRTSVPPSPPPPPPPPPPPTSAPLRAPVVPQALPSTATSRVPRPSHQPPPTTSAALRAPGAAPPRLPPPPAPVPTTSSSATPLVPPRVSDSPARDSEDEYDFEGPLGLVVPPTPVKPQPPAQRTSYAQVVKTNRLPSTTSKGSTLVQYDSSDAEMASPPPTSQELPPASATPSPTTTASVPVTLPRPAVATGFHTSSSVLSAFSRSITPPPRRQKVPQPESPELTPSSAIRHQRKRTKTTNASQPQVESSQTTGPSVRARQPVTTPPPLSAPAFVAAPVPAAGLPTRRQKVQVLQPHSLEGSVSSAIHHQRKRTKTTNVSQPQAESSQATASSLRAMKAVTAPPRVSAPPFVAAPPPNSDPSNLFDDDDGVDFASRNHPHQRQSPIGHPIVSQPRLPNSPTSSRRSASPPTTSVTQHMEHGDLDDDPFQATQDTPASDIEDSDDVIPPRQHLPTAVTAQSNDRVVNMRLTSFRGRAQAPPRRTYSTKRGRK